MKSIRVLILLLPGVLGACNKSTITAVPPLPLEEATAVLNTCRPRAEEIRQKLGGFREKLDSYRKRPTKPGAAITPTPHYDDSVLSAEEKRSINTAIVSMEQLSDVSARSALNLQFDPTLRLVLERLPTATPQTVYSDFRDDCERLADLRYVVIVRTLDILLPVETNSTVMKQEDDILGNTKSTFGAGFKPGHVKAQAYVGDLSTGEILATVIVESESSESMEFRKDAMITLQARLYDNLRMTTRKELADALSAETGGRFVMTKGLLITSVPD